MNSSKKAFIALALQYQVLKFGNFHLKSGRESPYFFDMGLFYDGAALKRIGEWYAQLLKKENVPIEHLFGAAYKGIPLASSTAIALSKQGFSPLLSFNRKEPKDHGEGGQWIGAALHSQNIVVIDDVITAGTAFRLAQKQIEQQGGKVACLLVALDRCEKGAFEQTALEELTAQGIRVLSLINIFDIIAYLRQSQDPKAMCQAECIEAYALQA